MPVGWGSPALPGRAVRGVLPACLGVYAGQHVCLQLCVPCASSSGLALSDSFLYKTCVNARSVLFKWWEEGKSF